MSLEPYLRLDGFTIEDQFWPAITDGYDGDRLVIYRIAPGSYRVKFTYTPTTTSSYRGSWASATGTYDPRFGVITGNIAITPSGGGTPVGCWFSIALDRTQPQPPDLPRIHVFVKSPIGAAPDEGSYTGQGN